MKSKTLFFQTKPILQLFPPTPTSLFYASSRSSPKPYAASHASRRTLDKVQQDIVAFDSWFRTCNLTSYRNSEKEPNKQQQQRTSNRKMQGLIRHNQKGEVEKQIRVKENPRTDCSGKKEQSHVLQRNF